MYPFIFNLKSLFWLYNICIVYNNTVILINNVLPDVTLIFLFSRNASHYSGKRRVSKVVTLFYSALYFSSLKHQFPLYFACFYVFPA